MNQTKLSRRDFLNLLLLVSLARSGVPLGIQQNRSSALYGRNVIGEKPEGGPLELPNILFIVFDTLSARHISLFGYPRETTPNIARFAKRSTVFHRHYAGGNFTVPGTASLLTGTYPWSHRGLHLFGSVRDEYTDRNLFSVFAEDYFISAYTHNALVMGLLDQFRSHLDQLTPPKELAVLSEPLSDRLFENDYFVSLWGERVVRGSGLGGLPGSLFLSYTELGEDFDAFTPEVLKQKYGALFPRGLPNHSIGLFFLLEDTIDWIKTQVLGAPRPFLGYYHMLPPHEPYKPRKEFIDRFNDGWQPRPKPILIFPQNRSEAYLADRRRQYDEYLAYVDSEFGRLLDALESSGIFDNTLVILTSDHGQLFERGIHGHVTSTLYEPVIHIPLMISRPGQKNRLDVHSPTSAIDILPTLLHLTGGSIPEWCAGQILPTFGSSGQDSVRTLFALEAKTNPKVGPLKVGTAALIKGRYKLVRYFGYDKARDFYELYDLENDPEELEDLSRLKILSLASELKEELALRIEEANQESQ
jgi:arylsulfatase A-like enzyme